MPVQARHETRGTSETVEGSRFEVSVTSNVGSRLVRRQVRSSAADLRFTPHALRFLFSILLAAKGVFGRGELAFDDCADRGQSFRRGGFKT